MTAAPTVRPTRNSSSKRTNASGSIKETIEQILVAFILAFVFRCFIVEAFVIPTGSMAPTLLGANVAFRCSDCGWRWTVNYSSPTGNDDNVPGYANEAMPARCPNCGYRVPRFVPGEPQNSATRPPVRFGDRILVQKYIYLLHEPERWDVVVFKSPSESEVSDGGIEPYTQNYIKRLVGLPNETVMVLDGDIYVAPASKPLDTLTPDDFVVQTKSRNAQEALWRIVYNADYQPRGLSRSYVLRQTVADPSAPDGVREVERTEAVDDPWQDPWRASGTGWTSAGRGYRFSGDGAAGSLKFDTTVAPQKHSMTDWLAYDATHRVMRNAAGRFVDAFHDTGYNVSAGDPLNNVSDVKLTLTYQRLDGDGSLRLNLTKQDHRFTAEFTAERVRLLMRPAESQTPVEIASARWSPGEKPQRIEFANVDYRVSIRVNDRELLATTPEQFKPNVAKLLQDFTESRRQQDAASVWLEAEGHACSVRHLSLWRDVYYLNRGWSNNPYYWGMPHDFPAGSSYGKPIQLGPDEFFVLGDNSMMSSDARVWSRPVKLPHERLDVAAGRVPRRFMLGRAFFVYWPAGFKPVDSLPAFAPNFGEMRFIH